MVPVQCKENPEGQNGCIIFENISYRLPVLDAYVLNHGHRNSALRVPIQCEENPKGQNGFVVFESRSYRIALSDTYAEEDGHQQSVCHEPRQNHVAPKVPVQCEENSEGQNGCIIFENISYRLHVLNAYV